MTRLIFLVVLSLTSGAIAQLCWDTRVIQEKARPGDTEAVATFHFVNAGTSLVHVADIQTSCGCTTALLTKTQFAPGESGDIAARFEFETHTGHQEKTIEVTTSDSPEQPTVLRLVVDIPEMVVLQPDVMFWKPGEAATAKTFRVTVGSGFSAKVLSVESDNPYIHVIVKPVISGKELEVSVAPTENKRPQTAMLSIKTDRPAANPQIFYLYVLVQ